jgi:hypothetical protein
MHLNITNIKAAKHLQRKFATLNMGVQVNVIRSSSFATTAIH